MRDPDGTILYIYRRLGWLGGKENDEAGAWVARARPGHVAKRLLYLWPPVTNPVEGSSNT
jgi:hypothetical protein